MTSLPAHSACHQERYERLAGEEAARLAAKRAAKEAEVYGSLDFKPQLNPRSLALAPAGSGGVEALASAGRQRQKLEELRAEEEARQRAECTFQVGGDAVFASCSEMCPAGMCGPGSFPAALPPLLDWCHAELPPPATRPLPCSPTPASRG